MAASQCRAAPSLRRNEQQRKTQAWNKNKHVKKRREKKERAVARASYIAAIQLTAQCDSCVAPPPASISAASAARLHTTTVASTLPSHCCGLSPHSMPDADTSAESTHATSSGRHQPLPQPMLKHHRPNHKCMSPFRRHAPDGHEECEYEGQGFSEKKRKSLNNFGVCYPVHKSYWFQVSSWLIRPSVHRNECYL